MFKLLSFFTFIGVNGPRADSPRVGLSTRCPVTMVGDIRFLMIFLQFFIRHR